MRKNILPHIIFICGVILLGYLFSNTMEVRKIKKYGLLAQAEWTGETKELGKMTMFIFNFRTKAGEMVSISMLPPISVEQLRNGEPVWVRYLEANPRETARFVGKEYGASNVLWVVGFLMALYGIYGIRAGRRA
jgi:hypothetical protein